MAKRYDIYDKKYIPGLGNGPFKDILLPDNKAVQLKQLGIKIKEASNTIPIFKEVVHTLQPNLPEEVIEEVPFVEVEPVVEEVLVPEEVIEESVVEEIIEEVPTVEETEVELTEESLVELTNAQLKQILTDNGIEIPNKDTKASLIAEIIAKLA